MKKKNDLMILFGLILIIVGAALSIYVGVWICFVGGIVDIIQQVRADDWSTVVVAWGIAKIVFAGFFGACFGIVVAIPGLMILHSRS